MLGLFSSSAPAHPPAVQEPPPKPSYFAATRHPFPCLVFLLPLLLLYEGSVIYLGDTNPDALRNGADCWLHGSLTAFGLHELYWAPALLVVTLILWSLLRRSDQPEDITGTCTGMAIESVFIAIGLWGLSRGLRPLLDRLGVVLHVAAVDNTTANVVSYLGAGIYEEAIFRLGLFTALCWVLRQGCARADFRRCSLSSWRPRPPHLHSPRRITSAPAASPTKPTPSSSGRSPGSISRSSIAFAASVSRSVPTPATTSSSVSPSDDFNVT
jgi:hypothetical protein